MLTRVRVDNYQCLVDFELELGPFTLLVGANGSGKTSLLEALRALRELLVEQRLVGSCFPSASRARWDRRAHQAIEIDVEREGARYRYELSIAHEQGRSQSDSLIRREHLSLDGVTVFLYDDGAVQLMDDLGNPTARLPFSGARSFLPQLSGNTTLRVAPWFLDYLERAFLGRIDPTAMSNIADHEDRRLASNGSNFAAWYRDLAQDNPAAREAIASDLREVIPNFEHMKLVASPAGRVLTFAFRLPTHTESYDLGFGELSDGQCALIALYTLVHATPEDTLLFIDEPDNFVTGRELQPWLTRAFDLARQRRLQLVLASHHPEVINYAAAEGAWLFERPGGGPAVARRLEVDLEAGQTADEALREALA